MYGDDDDWKRDSISRPLSFVSSPLSESIEDGNSYFDPLKSGRSNTYSSTRPHASTNGAPGVKAHTLPASMPSQRSTAFEHNALSPTHSLRDKRKSVADTANAQFPLNDIDYESNPAAVAQELSNLQALRRMSMDVGSTSDPDLPSFQGVSLMPSVAPTGDDDEDDPSRLFWVPARVHPELAPMEFKTFLENRVNTIKRRSGEQSSLSPEGLERSGSGGSLRRKKSMLSRQIDNSGGRGAVGYKDGADQLERNKSLSQQRQPELKIADLQELDELVRDPSKAMQKLTLDTAMRNELGTEVSQSEDLPILPTAPGVGLRRSTRTTYRRGSLRKGERVPFSKRAGQRASETDGEDSPVSSPSTGAPLTKVSSEPIAENFSRPNRGARRGQNFQQNSGFSAGHYGLSDDQGLPSRKEPSPGITRATTIDFAQSQTSQQQPQPRKSSYPRNESPIPQIVETPPQEEEEEEDEEVHQQISTKQQFPERSSSQVAPLVSQKSPAREPPPRSSKRPVLARQESSTAQSIPRVQPAQSPQSGQNLTEMVQHPSPLPGNASTRTDTLTFIPTLIEEKPSKKSKKEEAESGGLRKTSWGWFKGGDEKDKKEKRKDEEAKKSKTKVVAEKPHDNARLDVLQHSIEGAVTRGRESLLLDRESIDYKLENERKKESIRAKGGDGKKEKDGIFSSLFGGGKKKGDRDSGGKKASSLRTLSPEPPQRHLKPDIDYSWTRFSILEERAIYRMAHIKLANPRRALYSQVLLSNFMYSYLAKVQQMHPHVQIPQSAQQKKQQEQERRQKELEQQQALEQQALEQQAQEQGGDNYRYDYHQVSDNISKSTGDMYSPYNQGIADYAGDQRQNHQSTRSESVNYVDDSQIYAENQPATRQGSDRPQSRASHNTENGYGQQDQYGRQSQGHDYYPYGSEHSTHRDDDDDDDEMW
jgi:hypothetical protein